MSRFWTTQRMLDHLPAVYRERDAEAAARLGLPEGQGPLFALLDAIAEQVGLVEDQIAQTYDNWFVETCEDWLLPHLAELLAIDNIPDFPGNDISPRRYIANMLAYRAGKGTPRVLGEVVADSTRWFTQVVEYFLQLSRTAHVNRFAENEILGINVHKLVAVEDLGTAFDPTFRLPNVRRISSRHQRGRHNLPNLGVHVWPIKDHPWPNVPVARFAVSGQAQEIANTPAFSRWTIDPFGLDAPLFNSPQPNSAHRRVPEVVSRMRLYQELEELRRQIAAGNTRPTLEFFGGATPIVAIYVNGATSPIPAEEIDIVDFTRGWPAPAAQKSYSDGQQGSVDLPITLALDPHLGRIAFAPGSEPDELRCEYCYGFSMDALGGPYDRRVSIDFDRPVDWLVGVSQLPGVNGTSFDNLPDAIDVWNAQPAGTSGVLCIMDNVTYRETTPLEITIPRGSRLLLVAGHEPQLLDGAAVFSVNGVRGNLDLSIRVTGEAQGDGDPGILTMNGLSVAGEVRVMAGRLGVLDIAHSTIRGGVQVNSGNTNTNAELVLNLTWSHVTSIACAGPIADLFAADCLLGDPTDSSLAAVAAEETSGTFSRSTIFGQVTVREIWADDCLFLSPVASFRSQQGCIRYSYVAPGSQTPRRYECQPDLALRANPQIDNAVVEQQLRPVFESLDPADPWFARLKATTHRGILEGGEHGVEMGFLAGLFEPHKRRFANSSMADFTRAGMDAGLVTNTVKDLVNYGSWEQSS